MNKLTCRLIIFVHNGPYELVGAVDRGDLPEVIKAEVTEVGYHKKYLTFDRRGDDHAGNTYAAQAPSDLACEHRA